MFTRHEHRWWTKEVYQDFLKFGWNSKLSKLSVWKRAEHYWINTLLFKQENPSNQINVPFRKSICKQTY